MRNHLMMLMIQLQTVVVVLVAAVVFVAVRLYMADLRTSMSMRPVLLPVNGSVRLMPYTYRSNRLDVDDNSETLM